MTYGKQVLAALPQVLTKALFITAVPAIHPVFSIPTEPGGANHTPQFAKSAATVEAHAAMITISKALAATGVRVLDDAGFAARVRKVLIRTGGHAQLDWLGQMKKDFEDNRINAAP